MPSSHKTIAVATFAFLFFCLFVLLQSPQPARAAVDSSVLGIFNTLPADASIEDIQALGTQYGQSISVNDASNIQAQLKGNVAQTQGNWLTKLLDVGKWIKLEAGSQAFGSALRTALNTFAYDAASQIASGINGQQPAFEKRGFGELLTDSLDAAAGDFLYEFGVEGMGGLDLCQPSLGVNLSIGLGLWETKRPQTACKFSEMRANWEQELRDPGFLRNFQDYFNPTSNDLGISLSVQTMFLEKQANESLAKLEDYKLNRGWLDISGIDGKKRTPAPLLEETYYEDLVRKGDWAQYTGDALIDAANIFLNQLAIQLLRNLLWGGLSGSGGGAGIYDFQADTTSAGGIAAARDRFRQIVQPRFDVRGDYNILAELVQCPDPNRAGPTNCVITDRLRQAIQERKTVGQAMREGLLNGAGIFGFESKDQEPRVVDENYPYRSMLILRKFRILPVGWEVGARYINEYFGTEPAGVSGASKEDIRQTTLQEMVDCFDDDGRWCEGLIDPNWVLKAPLNYCAREGYGPETFGEPQVVNGEYIIARKDNYCADEQACIKENANGSCDVYGYCTQERRTWNFGTNSCNPVYNTCQTFADTKGATVSYLQNTLEWCDSNGNGCQSYATNYDYANQQWTDGESLLFLNKNAESCDAQSEGCHEFIRVKPGLGTNLIPNASFELGEGGNVDYWGADGSVQKSESDKIHGRYSLLINSTTARFPANSVSTNFSLRAGARYILSGYVKNIDATGGVYIDVGSGTTRIATQPITDSSESWQRVSMVATMTAAVPNPQIRVVVNGGQAYVDALQLEEVTTGEAPSAFKDYRDSERGNVIYEKKMPAAAQNFCQTYVDSNSNASQQNINICTSLDQRFARSCTANEVGCQILTRVRDNFRVPAKVVPANYCPNECDGYDTYIQQKSYFQPANTDAYFIPDTAQSCSAQAVGCEQFTNLDEVAQGGEGIEYYSRLRQCTADASQGKPFYTWEGSGESGFQLKVFTLKDDPQNNVPDVTFGTVTANIHKDDNDNVLCDAGIFNAAVTSGEYNPDCREFYSRSGNISYVLDSAVVQYSTNCHPYRLSEDYGSTSCTQSGGEYNSNGECIYMAIPQAGVQCQAQANACRAYTGNVGNNWRVVFADDFEDGQTADWASGVVVSDQSFRQNQKSLHVTDSTITKNIGSLLAGGRAASKSFEAELLIKGDAGIRVEVSLSGTPAKSFGVVTFNGDWQSVKLNVQLDDYVVSEALNIVIDRLVDENSSLYIDSVILRERADTYYLIRDSWRTPNSCITAGEEANQFTINATDNSGNIIAGDYQGCYEYKDTDDQSNYLYDFDGLCAESSAGCELMIDTNNYTPFSGTPADTPPGNTPLTDTFTYMVYDPAKLCDSNAKACQALGNPRAGGYDTVYLENNPDRWGNILCTAEQVSCEEYKGADGVPVYFKNPKDNVCEYRTGYYGFDWYQKRLSYCDDDNNGSINHASGALTETNRCASASDCDSNIKCVQDVWDTLCPNDAAGVPKTIGIGGVGNRIVQPAPSDDGTNWVGLCPAAESSCTEIIDPVSQPSVNLATGGSQTVAIKQNTAYIGSSGTSIDPTINGEGINKTGLFYLNNNNKLQSGTPESSSNNWLIFSAGRDNIAVTTPEDGYFREAVVNYQLASNLDYTSCNGQPKYTQGCVLFNERSVSGTGLKTLRYDAAGVTERQSGTQELPLCSGNECDANVLLKVNPDRVCKEWLACRSSAVSLNDQGDEERICYDIGICDGINDANQCRSWVVTPAVPENQTIDIADDNDKKDILDTVGYSKVGFNATADTQGYFHLGAMQQAGNLAVIPNGGFELSSGAGVPLNWQILRQNNTPVTDTQSLANIVSTVSNPQMAQDYDIRYPVEGSKFLALGTAFKLQSQIPLDISPDSEYTVTAQINTLSLNNGSVIIRLKDQGKESDVLIQPAGLDWRKQFGVFKSSTNGNTLTISIIPSAGSQGTIFVDDIQIRPSLAVKQRDNGLFYQQQSCRLYPKADALSCNYLDETSVNQKGWYGYCLEYDRAPVGNPEACLLWWPVDRVKGDGINEQVPSYAGRTPLYHCVETQDSRYVAIPEAFKFIRMKAQQGCTSPKDNGRFDSFTFNLLVGNKVEEYTISGNFWPGTFPQVPGYGKVGGSSANVELRLEASPAFSISGVNYYDFSKVAWITNAKTDCTYETGVTDIYNNLSLANHTVPICSRLVQTVDPLGQNKVWSARVQQGSGHALKCYDAVTKQITESCGYESDWAPFGSIAPPPPAGDPTLWSSKGGNVNIPLLAEPIDRTLSAPYQARFRYVFPSANPPNPTTLPTGLQLGTEQNLVRLPDNTYGSSLMSVFAKSYGSWSWQDGVAGGSCNLGGQRYCDNNYDKTCTLATAGVDCDFRNNVCNINPATATKKCVGGVRADATCTDDTSCEPDFVNDCDVNGICAGRTKREGSACTPGDTTNILASCWGVTSSSDLYGTCEESNSGKCSQSGNVCEDNEDCVTSTEVGKCTVGVCGNDATQLCLGDAQCGATNPGYRADTAPSQTPLQWSLPTALCTAVPGGTHISTPGTLNGSYCAVLPAVRSVTVNSIGQGNVVLRPQDGQAHLTFLSEVDNDQLPLVELRVNWGDGSIISITGMEMRERTNSGNPHSFYHTYSYWDLLNKDAGNSDIYCDTGNSNEPDKFDKPTQVSGHYCAVKPTVWIRDNWGWYSNSTVFNQPPNSSGSAGFNGWIVVTER